MREKKEKSEKRNPRSKQSRQQPRENRAENEKHGEGSRIAKVVEKRRRGRAEKEGYVLQRSSDPLSHHPVPIETVRMADNGEER